jgi:hypothetical protein
LHYFLLSKNLKIEIYKILTLLVMGMKLGLSLSHTHKHTKGRTLFEGVLEQGVRRIFGRKGRKWR